ncbi:MAG TPA: hypothetical protein VIY86_04175, partial [Pirellulaceae bacterium]
MSPIVVGGTLPYQVHLEPYDFGSADFPTLHSYASATFDNQWVLLAGRTNGLHSLTSGGFNSFPPASQNREVWVIDPVTRQTWHRSLESAGSGLSQSVVDSLTRTNTQFDQQGGTLYVTGGYGYDRTTNRFGTSDTLSAIDLGALAAWVQNGTGSAAAALRQLHDPIFKVTGGGMARIGGTTHLVFGQDFDGPYAGGAVDGHYTKQVRSFEVLDDGVELSIQNARQSMPVDAYRRRDLNVVPMLHRDPLTGELEQSLTALSGVFTPPPGFGIWTVPVEIDADGMPTMADPSLTGTFKQGMNTYHSAKLGLFDPTTGEMHTVLFGGISYQFYDRANGVFVNDPQVPFINQLTSIVRDAAGNYTQYLLDTEFPLLTNPDNGQAWRFGANAEFFVAPGLATLPHNILDLSQFTQPTTVGYIVGGLASDDGNFGNTAASNIVFRVSVAPVPEPRVW